MIYQGHDIGEPVEVKLVRRSICECGYPILKEHVPIGKVYKVYPKTLISGYVLLCGGCKKKKEHVSVLFAEDDHGLGKLPADIFDLSQISN